MARVIKAALCGIALTLISRFMSVQAVAEPVLIYTQAELQSEKNDLHSLDVKYRYSNVEITLIYDVMNPNYSKITGVSQLKDFEKALNKANEFDYHVNKGSNPWINLEGESLSGGYWHVKSSNSISNTFHDESYKLDSEYLLYPVNNTIILTREQGVLQYKMANGKCTLVDMSTQYVNSTPFFEPLVFGLRTEYDSKRKINRMMSNLHLNGYTTPGNPALLKSILKGYTSIISVINNININTTGKVDVTDVTVSKRQCYLHFDSDFGTVVSQRPASNSTKGIFYDNGGKTPMSSLIAGGLSGKAHMFDSVTGAGPDFNYFYKGIPYIVLDMP